MIIESGRIWYENERCKLQLIWEDRCISIDQDDVMKPPVSNVINPEEDVAKGS